MILVENPGNGRRVECEGACSLFQKLRGLMFRSRVVPLLFDFGKDGKHGIHSFFVPGPFYAIYISSRGKIVDKFRVAPFERYRENRVPARYLLEIGEEGARFFSEGDRVRIDAGVENTKGRGIRGRASEAGP